jgi:hypothetical protein
MNPIILPPVKINDPQIFPKKTDSDMKIYLQSVIPYNVAAVILLGLHDLIRVSPPELVKKYTLNAMESGIGISVVASAVHLIYKKYQSREKTIIEEKNGKDLNIRGVPE